ncbi:TetR/AcrR family transcriptional regulator [Demequina gelatinilytica]|uniref:TetR/AcrR family transcriptional regulator n=1 Tax=Demequina gelatinilytica TaxID=1638980 RepID=UPI00078199CB|nr:TetR/AcrR family transcriptional regulator [Demequina gelatinilytica]
MPEAPARRRRAGELLDAIREATLEELHERGYQGVTFEGVARRAGTSKPVLYRRFSNRADMVVDAIVSTRFSVPPAPLDGPLREDLIRLMRGVMERMGRQGVTTFRGVIGEVDDATVTRVSTLVLSQFEAWLDGILVRARAAGELGPAAVPPRVTAAILALLRHEMLFVYGSGMEPDLEGIVDDVVLPLLRATTLPDQAPASPA